MQALLSRLGNFVVWHGMFDVGFSLAKAGRIASEQVEPTVHRYEVTW